MKPGDLIRFNAAGQRNKTLGLLIEKRPSGITPWSKISDHESILVQWCIVGDMMPRIATPFGEPFSSSERRIQSGDFVWHPDGDWFEPVPNK